MNLTPTIRAFLSFRVRTINQYAELAQSHQSNVLKRLIISGRNTCWGKLYHYRDISCYDDFRKTVPISCYDDIKPFIERMRKGEKNVLWPGKIKWYAKSSGTTHYKSKYIPVSNQGLNSLHYVGGLDSIALYLNREKNSRLFQGKGLILGGSYQSDSYSNKSITGDLSAILIDNINPLVNFFRVPDKKTALIADFEEKSKKIALQTINSNVTNISGVPSWMMGVLKQVLEISGKEYIGEVWPNFEVFFHGGVSFAPYREQYKRIINSNKMRFMETYNASEGFFGIQDDPDDNSMLLMVDYDVFYEFIPLAELDNANPKAIPLAEVQLGQTYAMLISTSCGLWRYLIGDTVKFTCTKPYKFIITGRTNLFINTFGEELMIHNTERGVAEACKLTKSHITDYTVAPVFMDDNAKCRHQWLVEFDTPPESLERFSTILDNTLQQLNSDYEAKRFKDITLQPLEIIVARKGLFNEWLKSKGKLGGQHKVPRLSNSRELIEELIKLNFQE
ncbi:MAG TPA: GH3 auxin-responsive promoter family protein [Bacteroidaceae bacterium]|nr:GH3 auxin-responsive promoter family protein [Bacteroidaceae bacterium]